MKTLVCLVLCLLNSFVYAAAEEESTIDVPVETIDVPVDVSHAECPICLSQMTDEDFQKNGTMNGNKIHDNCFANEDYFLHKDCFFEGLKNQIRSGTAKIQFKFSSDLNSHVHVLFYDPTYVVDFLYEYFAGSDEAGQEELEGLVSQFIENWERFAKIVSKEIPCQNSECDEFYPNPDQDIYYKPVGQVCSKCGTIYKKEAFTKLDKKTLEKARLCPNCGDIVEKIDGCDNMVCPHCKTQFYWHHAGRIEKISWGPKDPKNQHPHRSCSLM